MKLGEINIWNVGMCGLMLGLVGCQSGLYQIVTSEDDKELDDRMSYYEAKLVGTKSERVEFEPISSDSLYDSQKMPICVVNGKSKCEPDKTGISSFGWLFTLGIIPMCESGFRMQEITVKTPLGDKNGWYRVDAKRWSGWLPIFIGYPGIADKRAADASVNGVGMSEMLSLARQSAVESLARQFSYDEYVSFAKKANAERGQEIVHIEEVTKHVNELIAKFDFATAERLCEKELGVKRKGSVTGDAVTWKALEDKVAKAKEDHRVDTKKKNLEALLKENKFAEVLAAIEEEKHPFSQELPKFWHDLWTKTTEARDAFVRKQKEEARAKEVSRIEAKKKILESLMKEKKYEEVIKQCESENEFANGVREGYDASDLEIWKSYSQMAKKEIEHKERLIREARELADRQKEEKRIKEKVTKLDYYLSLKKYEQVIEMCDAENGLTAGAKSEDAAIWSSYRTKAEQAWLKSGGTPLSFCGINFGEKIDLRFPDAGFKDNSKERTYEFSYMVADLKLGKPFRNFKEGNVYAAMTSKRIYKVELTYYFPRGVSAAVDDAEYQGTLQALQTKYGVSCTEETGWGGDKKNVFKVGNVLISLKFVTEGIVDRGHLILTAENVLIRAAAESECRKYYQERSRRDVENMKGFQNGGVDVL